MRSKWGWQAEGKPGLWPAAAHQTFVCSQAEGFHICGREPADLGGCSDSAWQQQTRGYAGMSVLAPQGWSNKPVRAECSPHACSYQSILQQCVPAPHCSSIIPGRFYLAVRNRCRACFMGATAPRLRELCAFAGDGRSGGRTA